MINPTFVKIPESWGILRDTIPPKEKYKEDSFGKTFDETYDYDTLFSGVVRIEDTLILCAPSFLNLKKFISDSIKFINSTCEDYTFLETIHKKGGIIYMSDHITYNVRS